MTGLAYVRGLSALKPRALAEVAGVLVLQLVLFQLAEEIGFSRFFSVLDPLPVLVDQLLRA
jgi:hypothetical protein